MERSKSATARHRKPKGEGRAVFTVGEVAKLLGIGRISAYRAAERGDIPSIRLGRRIVVPKAAFYLKFGNSSD